MKCPRCGQEMESGYLNAYSFGARAIVPFVMLRWKDSRKEITERLGSKAGFMWANMDVDAFRCPNCQIITFSYTSAERGEFQEKAKPEDYSYGDVEKYLR